MSQPVPIDTLQAITSKVENLEVTHAYHDDSIHELEKTVAAQHQEIQHLKKQLSLLSEYLKTLKDEAVKDIKDETPPPHY